MCKYADANAASRHENEMYYLEPPKFGQWVKE